MGYPIVWYMCLYANKMSEVFEIRQEREEEAAASFLFGVIEGMAQATHALHASRVQDMSGSFGERKEDFAEEFQA